MLLYDVRDGNPNGDPDSGNSPRVDPETGHGLVSDVCIKRKIRNFIAFAQQSPDGSPKPGYEMYVKDGAILNRQHERAYHALGIPLGTTSASPDEILRIQARSWMCEHFFDVRMFGAVMSTRVNAGQVRGPVQITFSRSVDPVTVLAQPLTRSAVTTAEDSIRQKGLNRTIARKEIIPYALYRCHGFVNPFFAAQTGFSNEDLRLLWQALEKMFELDRAAARGEMATRRLFVFEHQNALGNAPAHELFERIKVVRRDGKKPPRLFSDYEISVSREKLNGVSFKQLL